MKILEKILYVEWKEALECGISENTLKRAKLQNFNSWSFIEDTEDKRKVLIEYNKLKDDYKAKIKARFGDPYDFIAKQPIKNLIKWDHKAEEFFLSYRFDGNKSLPIEHVKKYAHAASVLNMLKAVNEDKKALKNLLKLTIEQFYIHLIEIIKLEKIDLPTSYRRLIASADKYAKEGYTSLIDWRFGNKLAAKVSDEVSESVLKAMIAHANDYDDVFISWKYNEWAAENNYKQIDRATVGVWRRKFGYELDLERKGNSELKGKYLRQAKGYRPTAPLLLVESDDNHLDLLFEDPENKGATKRYVAYVVTDSFNDHVLGYSYALEGTLGGGGSVALIKAAYTNAMYYIRSITGSWHLPHETKTDRWALASLEPFYKSMGNYFATPVMSKNRGYLENFFGSHHWKRCLKAGAINYSGNNMTAKNRGVNMEVLAQNKKHRPMIGNEATRQIESFFHNLRHMPQGDKLPSKHQQWMEAWNRMEFEKRPMSEEQFLLKFGVEHNADGKAIKITNRGVEPQIAGIRYSYDIEGGSWIEHIGKQVKVFYDPYDMSRVLITDNDKLRLLAREARLNSRALADAHTDSRTYLNSILNERKQDVEKITAKSTKRKQILDSINISAETLLQSGVMEKEIKQAAETKVLINMLEGSNHNEYDIFNQL